MASLDVPASDKSLVDLFEKFLETLISTHTAVSINNDSVHKIQFQLYLKTALVPITSVARGLWYTEENTDFTTGTTEEICHKILSNMMRKIEYVQSLDITDDPRLHLFARTKMQTIRKKLLIYQHMADLFSHEFYDC